MMRYSSDDKMLNYLLVIENFVPRGMENSLSPIFVFTESHSFEFRFMSCALTFFFFLSNFC